MPKSANSLAMRPIVLRLSTAAELMTRNPLALDKFTPIHKAAEFLECHDLEAAPIVDQDARPIGIVTSAACSAWREFCVRSSRHALVAEHVDQTTVAEIMRPVVEIVHQQDSSRDVIRRLFQDRLRRVYVVDDEGVLVGVVSASDILRHLLIGGKRGHGHRAAVSFSR